MGAKISIMLYQEEELVSSDFKRIKIYGKNTTNQ